MNQNDYEELKSRELLEGFADGFVTYCEGEFGPARDDLKDRLRRKSERKELANMLLQRLAWIAAITGGLIAVYNAIR